MADPSLGYLLHVILAIVVVSIAESGSTTGLRAPWVVPCLAGLAYVPAVFARTSARRGRFRFARICVQAIGLLPVALFAVALLILGWYETIADSFGEAAGLAAWPHPALFLVLSPFVLYGLVAIDARARAVESLPEEVRRQRRFHARMLFAALTPFAVFVLATWAIGTHESLRVHIEEVGAFGAAFALVLLTSLVVLLPFLLTRAWNTRPLPAGPVRAVLEQVADRAGFRCRDLYVWDTEHLVANAAIVGLVPHARAVLFSDALLSMLDLRELVAVFGHEVGHAKRRHVLLFVTWAVAFLMALDVVLSLAAPQTATDALLWAAPLVLVGIFGFRWMSRRFELDADLFAAEVTGDPEALASALLRVGGPGSMKKSSWRHFSTEKRLAFLQSVSADPSQARAFRTRLRVLSRLAIVMLLLAMAGQAWVLRDSWHEGHLMAELRLGRYADAETRLVRIEGPNSDLERVVATVAALGEDVSIARTEAAALAATREGRAQDAADLVEVLCLRGRPLEWVLDALTSGEAPVEVRSPAKRDSEWFAALAARGSTGAAQ